MKRMLIVMFFFSLVSVQASISLAQEVNLSSNEVASIKVIMKEVIEAANAGNDKLVTQLIVSAMQQHPKLAEKIMAALVNNQAISGTMDISAIVSNVMASLQNQQGSEALVAAVLSSYNPAAGSDKIEQKQKKNTTLPPALPPAGQIGSGIKTTIPTENPSQTSSH